MRSAEERMRYSTADGLPNMSRATSPAISMSNPAISPVTGSRKENRLLPMSSPTSSRPRWRMDATAASAWALLGNGRRLAVRSQVFSPVSGGRGGSGLRSSIPAGVGGARVGAGGSAGSPGCAHPPRTVPAATANAARVLTHTRIFLTGTHSTSATSPTPPPVRPPPTASRHQLSYPTAHGGRTRCHCAVVCGSPEFPGREHH